MADNYHGEPLLVRDDEAVSLSRVMVGDADGGGEFNEDYIRNLAFDHPGCLPIGEIDSAYLNPIPVCKELWTPAGPIDALYITEEGRLVVVEACSDPPKGSADVKEEPNFLGHCGFDAVPS